MGSKFRLLRIIIGLSLVSFLAVTCSPSTQTPTGQVQTSPSQTHVSVPSSELTVVFNFDKIDPANHSVAFATGTFIDLHANSLGSFLENIFGAAGIGWLDRSTETGIGDIRWAGSAGKTAELKLDVPKDTEGLFVKVRGAVDGMLMMVNVGNDAPVFLQLDSSWRTIYIPVGAPVREPAPAAAPVWTAGHYFPDFPPPSGRIYSFKINTALENWWGTPSKQAWRINQDPDTMTALTLTSLQGIINRSGPRVYLDWVGDGTRRDSSNYWVPVLQKQTDVMELDLDSQSAFLFLWRRFGDRFAGAVVYDPEIPDTINLATMIAGLENRIILAPEQLKAAGMPAFNSITDLHQLVQEQNWDNTPEGRLRLYQWVYDNLWNRLEKRAIGVISPGPPSTIMLKDTQTYDPLGLAPRDYYIALRLPALWISPSQALDSKLFERFLQDAPPSIPVMANYVQDEDGMVHLISRYADWTPAITLDNAPLSAGNLSVFSSVRPNIIPYKASINPDHILATLGDRPVVTVWISDGDNIHYQLDQGFPGPLNLTWNQVNTYPAGWTTNPILAEIAPAVWNSYVTTAKGMSFIAGVSGGGYAYPPNMDNQKLDAYLQRTDYYFKLTGLRTLIVDDLFGKFDQRLATHYYQNLKDIGLLGIVKQTAEFGNPFPIAYYGAPIPIVSASYLLGPGNGAQIAEELLSTKAGEVNYVLSEGDPSWQKGKIVSDGSASSGKASLYNRASLPDCCMVVVTPPGTLVPGNYTVTYHLKVSDNHSNLPIAHLMSLRQSSNGQASILATRWITPVDFQKAGEYQDFTITFKVTEYTPGIQLWMDYTGGTSGNANVDLYADTIKLTRSGASLFPPVAPVLLCTGCGYPGSMNPDLLAITTAFENSGGVVLQPDEFMAAFNPEFMIEFATHYLKADDPAIWTAKQELQQGKYFESLVTIREALKAVR